MSDQGAGFPPPEPPAGSGEGAREGAWEPVTPPPPDHPPPPQGQYPPPGYGPAVTPTLSSQGAATLSYVTFIPAIILLVIEPYRRDEFVKFHAWQCIVLSGVWIAGNVLFLMLGRIGHLMDFLLHVILFVFWLIAIVNANRGVRYHVPLVGDVAENLARSVSV